MNLRRIKKLKIKPDYLFKRSNQIPQMIMISKSLTKDQNTSINVRPTLQMNIQGCFQLPILTKPSS